MRKIDKAKNFDFSTAPDGRLFGVADIAKLRFRKGRKVGKVEIYDPWNNVWTEADNSALVSLPEFKRSTVVKLTIL